MKHIDLDRILTQRHDQQMAAFPLPGRKYRMARCVWCGKRLVDVSDERCAACRLRRRGYRARNSRSPYRMSQQSRTGA